MNESGTFRVLELFICKFLIFLSFHFILIICLDRYTNNSLLAISEMYYCSFYYVMKYDIKLKKYIFMQQKRFNYGSLRLAGVDLQITNHEKGTKA